MSPRSWRLRTLPTLVTVVFIVSACVTVPRDGEPAAGATSQPTATPTATPTEDAASATEEATTAPTPTEPATTAPPSTVPSAATPSPTEAVPTPPPRSAERSIGYISLDEKQAFVQSVSGGIREAAAAAGVRLVECDSGWTRQGVDTCAEELAQAGVHGIISFQPYSDLGAAICETTGDAPTIGVIYDQGPCQVSRLEIDQARSGRLAGEALGRLASERWGCDVEAYLSLESGEGDPIGAARMQGYREGYERSCPLPRQTFALSDAQHLATARTQVLARLERLKGKPILVAAVSDIAALGAIRAADAAGRRNHLWVSGQLADRIARDEIACDERFVASVAQFPERFGASLVPTLMDALDGDDVPPLLEADLELVTSANVRELFPDTPACDV